MEINDFSELNALNKLLGKIKFQEDLDFFEFKEFVGSPLIASIHKRVHREFLEKAKKQGHLKKVNENDLNFNFESTEGKCIKRRINEWTEKERVTLSGLKEEDIERLLLTLITPFNCEKIEFEKLKKFAFEIINRTSN